MDVKPKSMTRAVDEFITEACRLDYRPGCRID
jgi:hypothetical protein